MKKIIAICLIMIFPFIVNSKEEIYVNYNEIIIMQNSQTSFLYDEKYEITNTFGNSPLNYFEKEISNKQYYGLENMYYGINIRLIESKTNHNYETSNIEDDKTILRFGTIEKELNEKENIEISYLKTLENYNSKTDKILLISSTKYKVKNTKFFLYLDSDELSKNILFSKDNKNYTETLENLKYTIDKENNLIEGEYTEELKPNEKIYIKFASKHQKIEKEKIVVYASLMFFGITLFFTFLYLIIKKTKKTK